LTPPDVNPKGDNSGNALKGKSKQSTESTFTVPSDVKILTLEEVKRYGEELLEKKPSFRIQVAEQPAPRQSSEEAIKSPFYIHFKAEYVTLPEPTDDTLSLFMLTNQLLYLLWKKPQIAVVHFTGEVGLAGDAIDNFVKSLDNGLNVIRRNQKMDLLSSFLAKFFLDFIIKKYRSRFVNLKREEKVPNYVQFMDAIGKSPLLRGKETSLVFKYCSLLYGIIDRLYDFKREGDLFSNVACNRFYRSYIESSLQKDTLKECLKENRVKIIDINSFNDVMFDDESNHIDMSVAGKGLPNNFSKEFAIAQSKFDHGDLLAIEKFKEYNRIIKETLGERTIEVLFKRMKVRNRIANTREMKALARTAQKSSFKMPWNTYLPFMEVSEANLVRPGAISLLIEGFVDTYKDTAVVKSCYMVSTTMSRNIEIKRFNFNVERFKKLSIDYIHKQYYQDMAEVMADHPSLSGEQLQLKLDTERSDMQSAIGRIESVAEMIRSTLICVTEVFNDLSLL